MSWLNELITCPGCGKEVSIWDVTHINTCVQPENTEEEEE